MKEAILLILEIFKLAKDIFSEVRKAGDKSEQRRIRKAIRKRDLNTLRRLVLRD